MNGQDALDLVPGRPLHDELMRRERINRSMLIGDAIAAIGRGLRNNPKVREQAARLEAMTDPRIPPGACVLCGTFPEGALPVASEEPQAWQTAP